MQMPQLNVTLVVCHGLKIRPCFKGHTKCMDISSSGFRLPRHLFSLHVAKPHANAWSGEAVQEAHVHHARYFVIRRKGGSCHTAADLALCFAASRRFNATEGTASTAQTWRSTLAADVALQAQEGLLCRTADVVETWDAAVVAAAASMVHDHLRLINGVKVHPSLRWGRHHEQSHAKLPEVLLEPTLC